MTEPLQCAYFYLTLFSMMSSRMGHVIITIERLFYIVWPYSHQRMVTFSSTVVILILSWTVSLLTALYIVLDCQNGINFFTLGVSVIDPCAHFVQLIVMSSMYAHIVVITRRQIQAIKKNRVGGVLSDKPLSNMRQNWNTIRMPVRVFVGFFSLVTPIVCANVYNFVVDPSLDLFALYWYEILEQISFFHTWTNFFVYAIWDREFRSTLKNFLTNIGHRSWRRSVHPENK